jgi:hypothetical protein
VNADEDPGWRPAIRPIWMFLIPWIAILPRRRRLDLIGLRRLFLHMGIALIELAIVISSLSIEAPRDSTWAWLLLGLGSIGSFGGLVWTIKAGWRGPPDSSALTSAGSVANSFRALSFIRLGFIASPALFGIVGTQLTGAAEMSVVGAAVTIAMIVVFGPTRSRVDEVQERLRASGSPISLRAALAETAS